MDVMQLRRNLLMMQIAEHGLPAEYMALEYIEGTGTQYIDVTGTLDKYEFDVTAMFTATRTNNGFLTGNSLYNDQNVTAIQQSTANFNVSRKIGSNVATYVASAPVSTYLGQKLRFLCYMAYAEIQDGGTGETIARNDNGIQQTDYYSIPVYLFHCYSDGAYRTRYINAKVYSAKYYLNNALAFDLVPCIRIADWKPGVFDLVGQQFYVNNGTGEFDAGIEGWDYFLFKKYSDTTRLRPVNIPITEGQKVTIAWSGCTSNSYTYRLWGLKDGATFVGETRENLPCGNIPSDQKPDGQLTYTVETSGSVVVGGLHAPGTTSYGAYTFPGNWIKVKIT